MSWPIPPRYPTDDELRDIEIRLDAGETLEVSEAWTLIRAVRGLQGMLKRGVAA